ncbi:methyltransferase [Providencia manganoxydans]|uniref:methyltransferase n=1 Tax=Providencia manganoxydans TaxID=2923283 RepID=UPI0034E4E260
MLKREPSLKGILFDTEAVLKKHILSQLNDDTRWQLCSGSFFEQCPEADIYLLKYITHDWSDEKIQQILHTIHKAMKPSSKLLIIDNIIPEGDQPYFGKEMDLIMMTSFSGASEHTQSEFSTLLSHANFKMNNVISTGCHLYIIEAVPV